MKIETLSLWPAGSRHTAGPGEAQRLDVFLPDGPAAPARATVLVCPGGGYAGLAPHEGEPFARLFSENSMVGAVCYYRVAPWRYPAPQADAARAVRLLRANAGPLGIDPTRVALMGFSAGGHLVSTIATQPGLHVDPEDGLAATWSPRPDRLILAYPVISLCEHPHLGSVANLLGEPSDRAMRERLSNERHVQSDNPPTFLFHTADDPAVPVENSLRYAEACRRAGVPVELHVYQSGRHGVGLAADMPALRSWIGLLLDWLRPWALEGEEPASQGSPREA
jgi:acetyl esterase/lipase